MSSLVWPTCSRTHQVAKDVGDGSKATTNARVGVDALVAVLAPIEAQDAAVELRSVAGESVNGGSSNVVRLEDSKAVAALGLEANLTNKAEASKEVDDVVLRRRGVQVAHVDGRVVGRGGSRDLLERQGLASSVVGGAAVVAAVRVSDEKVTVSATAWLACLTRTHVFWLAQLMRRGRVPSHSPLRVLAARKEASWSAQGTDGRARRAYQLT